MQQNMLVPLGLLSVWQYASACTFPGVCVTEYTSSTVFLDSSHPIHNYHHQGSEPFTNRLVMSSMPFSFASRLLLGKF